MTKKEREFQAFVLDWYEKCGRHDLPWRQDHDPYKILVSELMLQQTQVARVIPKYLAFIKQYPTITKLAEAQLGDVLRLWQGLGYNRRAKFLFQCAEIVVNEHHAQFPTEYEQLLKLPGIGPYTASAVCAFAFNQPVTLIETNVRQVYIHHFFAAAQEVTDAQLIEKVDRTLPVDDARNWYAALMDYGTHLKAIYGNNTSQVKGYTKQSTFKGSNREVRGAIVRLLVAGSLTVTDLWSKLDQYEQSKIQPQLDVLLKDSLIIFNKGKYHLP
jgi:A/G-specific adenine glycosylase